MNANQTPAVVVASAVATTITAVISYKIAKKIVVRKKQNASNDLWEKATDRISAS